MNLDEGTTAEKRRSKWWLVALPVFVVVGVIVAAGVMARAGDAPAPPTPAAATTTPGTATPGTATPGPAATGQTGTDDPAPADAWSTTVAFLDVWRDPNQQTRAAALGTVATPRLAEGLASTSPAKTVTGRVETVTVETVSPYTVTFRVAITGTDTVRVAAVIDPGAAQGWLVDHVAPIEDHTPKE